MDVLPRPLAQLSDQIRHLGPAARIQLVVIPLLVLVGLGVMLHLGGKSAEEALMSGRTLNTEELKAAEKAFQRLALDQYRIVDRKILVPKTEAARYQSALMSSDVGVADTFGKEFAKALETNPLFAGTGSQQVDRMDLARAQVLTNMIKAISYVEDAQVVWSRAKGRSFNTTQRMTALLTVKPRSGQELTAERAKTLQQAVAGCFGMQAEDVTVLDGRSGISVRVDIAESSRQSEHLSAVREYAAHYQQMISEALKDIPNVIIAVNPEIASPALSERTSPQSQPKLQSLQATISIPKDYYREVLSRKQSRPLEKHELRSRLRQIQVDTERDVEQRIARLLPGTSHDLKQNPIKVSSYERLDANEQPSAIDSKPFEQLSRWTRSWGGYAVLSVIACTALWTLFRNPEAPHPSVAQPSEANGLMIPADNALETLTDSEELPLRSHRQKLQGLLKDHPELEEAVSELTAEEALDGGGRLSLVTRDAPLPRGEYTSSLPISASARTVDDTSMRSSNRSAFDFLNPAAPEFIVSLIATEHPQAIALILSFLPPALSAGVVSQLPTEVQIEVVRRLATLEPIHPDVVKDIEQGLRARMQARLQARHDKPQEISPDGISTVAQLLSASDRPTNREILRNLEYENPELVEKIHRQMFEFDDLLQLDDTTLRRLFNQVDPAYWALALKGASEDMKLKIMSKLSRRSANLLVEELQYLGPVRLSDIETAQQQIVDMIRHLDDAAVPHPEVAGLAT